MPRSIPRTFAIIGMRLSAAPSPNPARSVPISGMLKESSKNGEKPQKTGVLGASLLFGPWICREPKRQDCARVAHRVAGVVSVGPSAGVPSEEWWWRGGVSGRLLRRLGARGELQPVLISEGRFLCQRVMGASTACQSGQGEWPGEGPYPWFPGSNTSIARAGLYMGLVMKAPTWVRRAFPVRS